MANGRGLIGVGLVLGALALTQLAKAEDVGVPILPGPEPQIAAKLGEITTMRVI